MMMIRYQLVDPLVVCVCGVEWFREQLRWMLLVIFYETKERVRISSISEMDRDDDWTIHTHLSHNRSPNSSPCDSSS